jgi:hypothetical protein
MIAIALDDRDAFESWFRELLGRARRPAGVLAVAGRTAANELRKHFLAKDRLQPNKLAPDRRQHFWQQVAHAVQAPVVDEAGNSVSIQIRHPDIAQKVFGGTITAKRVSNLAIPESDEAYGRAPSVFEHETGLKLIFIKANDHAFLAARIDPNSKFLEVEYLLTPSVHQDPDPTALPDPQLLQAAVILETQKVVERQLKEGGAE